MTALLAEGAAVPDFPKAWKMIRAERSGHWVQLDRPDLVIEAIHEMVSLSLR